MDSVFSYNSVLQNSSPPSVKFVGKSGEKSEYFNLDVKQHGYWLHRPERWLSCAMGHVGQFVY